MPTHTAHWGASNGLEAHFKMDRTLSQALPALHQPLQVRAVYLFVQMPYTFFNVSHRVKRTGKPQVGGEARTRVRLVGHVPQAQNLKNAKKLTKKYKQHFKAMS